MKRLAIFQQSGWRMFAAASLGLIACIALVDVLFPPPLERGGETSTVVLDNEGRWVRAFATDEGRWRFAANLDEIDTVFIQRLLAIEDKRFWRHPGVDGAAVLRAGASAVQNGRIVSGASTITMQTARLLEPRPRNLQSKAVEMLRALQIERRLSKREILELYLTLAPYGGNIEGVRAASLVYFDKEPRNLSDAEQALLIALPQAPEARRPDRRQAAAKAARIEILKKLAGAGALEGSRVAEASEASLTRARKPFPANAYHASRWLARNKADKYGVAHSTLDLPLQQQAERIVRNHGDRASGETIAALIIVDHETNEVRASVGSSGLDAPGGWNDMTMALRSPGSTLKPFIYAMAFDDGIASPDAVIEDMPRLFGDYAPENFDRTFRGEVRIKEALAHSLNLPAVKLLDSIGAARFAARLSGAGIGLMTPKRADKNAGLAIALGGAGVTARDIATLYAGLANEGNLRPLRWTTNEQGDISEHRLMSGKTARRISAILAEGPSLAGRAPAALALDAPSISFKTGTSYGYRDAWAAGHGGRYTVVAWVGRADGAPRPGETGRKAAAPLLFDIFDMLATYDHDGWREAPEMFNDSESLIIASRAVSQRINPPEIIFPRPGVEVYVSSVSTENGFVLSARGGAGEYQWFVNGQKLDREETSGRAIWRPDDSGFFTLAVVDREGRTARSKVRVHISS